MADIINIMNDGVIQYPITKPECVIDENGKNVLQLIQENAGSGGGGIATETDPVFSASAAADITAEDIAEWNSKQDAISDLESIRDGASKGATALQEEAYKGTIEAVDTNESVEDPELEYATTQYVDTAIANAITTVLNTEV